MKTLALVLWSVFVGSAAMCAFYEVEVLPSERSELYTQEATASDYLAQLTLASHYLGICVNTLEDYAAAMDNCERRLMTCAGVKQ